jgi:vacuole morphology and inheritance protein 14
VNVRNAADVLDGLVKDIVTEGNTIDMDKFIPMLSKRVYVTNTECRKFLVNWLVLLDNVPDIEMVQYLPKFLDGIFIMLSDPSDEIRSVVGAALSEFLAQVRKRSNRVDFGALVQIVITHCSTSDPYNFITCQTAVSWVNELIVIGSEQILRYGAQLLNGILPCISHSSKSTSILLPPPPSIM